MGDRDELLHVINDKAVIRGDFVLSSGQHADWYIDLRRVLLSGASAAPSAAACSLRTSRSRCQTKAAMPITATAKMTYPASANPCATFCHSVPTA